MPKEWHDLVHAFSETESNKLAPYQTYDYKIELTDKNSIRYSLLQQHTEEELLAMKKYITKNLYKRFLVLSSILFASLILFSQKGDRSLQFCIDYQKLNAITYKNCYLLLLLEETISCLSRA